MNGRSPRPDHTRRFNILNQPVRPGRADESSSHQSPTDMGVDRAGFAIINDEAAQVDA
jgi:uncharacterized protein (UPF0371 family)